MHLPHSVSQQAFLLMTRVLWETSSPEHAYFVWTRKVPAKPLRCVFCTRMVSELLNAPLRAFVLRSCFSLWPVCRASGSDFVVLLRHGFPLCGAQHVYKCTDFPLICILYLLSFTTGPFSRFRFTSRAIHLWYCPVIQWLWCNLVLGNEEHVLFYPTGIS